MEIRDNDRFLIIAPLTEKPDTYDIEKVKREIAGDTRIVGIDLNYISDCTIGFVEGLKEICMKREIGIFNIPSDVFAIFNIMNIDKAAKLFVSEPDFEENTRVMINRKFKLCKTSI